MTVYGLLRTLTFRARVPIMDCSVLDTQVPHRLQIAL
jgi:hypothetical protein